MHDGGAAKRSLIGLDGGDVGRPPSMSRNRPKISPPLARPSPRAPANFRRWRSRAPLSATDQDVRTDVVVGRCDGDVRLGLPVQREIEVPWEYLPSLAVVQFDDVALGMESYPHGAPLFRVGELDGRARGYFCPDGAWAFELSGFGLLAS